MNASSNNQDDKLREAVRSELGSEPFPPKAQVKLEEAYASLHAIPQDKVGAQSQTPPQPQPQLPVQAPARATVHRRTTQKKVPGEPVKAGKRVVKRGMVVAIAAAFVVLLGGTAFAATSLLQMKPGEVPFFESGSNLPIYNSLQAGVASLNTEVGESVLMGDATVTLDTISTDRNIVNLFFTMEKEGGFDLESASAYEGSNENEWVRLQRLLPVFQTAQFFGNGELFSRGDVHVLDAYKEGEVIKVLMRIVPKAVLPDEVSLVLTGGIYSENSEQGQEEHSFEVGLDLSTVEQPDELGAQDLVFQANGVEKTLGIKRFTRSELGTVFIVRNDEIETIEASGRPIYNPSETSMMPYSLKITDDQGNVLHTAKAGSWFGYNPGADYVMELTNMSKEARAVSFTPMAQMGAPRDADTPTDAVQQEELANLNPEQQVDVTQIGTLLPTSEHGGYEITGWDVEEQTVKISLRPYGWVNSAFMSAFELLPIDQPTPLKSGYVDPETGEEYGGYHTGLIYHKYDYQTGEVVQTTSYYAASDEELRNMHLYRYRTNFGYYAETASATQTLTFSQAI